MAKKRKPSSAPQRAPSQRGSNAGGTAALEPGFAGVLPIPPEVRPKAVAAAPVAVPQESGREDWAPFVLCAMMVITPAIGAPTEELLQDTLKSIVVSFATLLAAFVFFWKAQRRGSLRWHSLMWVPLAWMTYAAIAATASVFNGKTWGHPYLSTVEMIRWFIFAVLLWVTLNCMTRARFKWLALSIHLGAVIAAFWGVMQFVFDMRFFPQGPAPASTFVNRNFASEFIACTLPFAIYSLAQMRSYATISLLSASVAFNVVYLFMTGTRSALAAVLFSGIFVVVWAVQCRKTLPWARWTRSQAIVCAALFFGVIFSLGNVPSGSPLTATGVGGTAFDRMLQRSVTFTAYEYTAGSTSLRFRMWRNTAGMISKVPFFGVGPGSWESMQPLYQDVGAQIETDYYVHNETLQLLAEYGLLGWVTLIGLVGLLARSQWKAVWSKHPDRAEELMIRWIVLAGFTAFMCSSQFGFPWRLASTGAMFALMLGVIAASDARLGITGPFAATAIIWRSAWSTVGVVLAVLCSLLAAFITERAIECEKLIVRATKLALGVSASGDPNNPRFERTKAEIRDLIRRGTDINPHYRKITPMVADEFAKWGDWASAVPVWMSVLSSRPYIPAILSNAARGYSTIGQNEKALELLERARRISPDGISIRSLEIILLARTGKMEDAAAKAREAFDDKRVDYDAAQASIIIGRSTKDWPLVRKALEWRETGAPQFNADTFMQQAELAWNLDKDLEGAVQLYRKAMKAATPQQRQSFIAYVPEPVRVRVMQDQ